jgi:hypothetical protein
MANNSNSLTFIPKPTMNLKYKPKTSLKNIPYIKNKNSHLPNPQNSPNAFVLSWLILMSALKLRYIPDKLYFLINALTRSESMNEDCFLFVYFLIYE